MRSRALFILWALAITAALAFVFRQRLAEAEPLLIERAIYLMLAGLVVGGAFVGRARAGARWSHVLIWAAIVAALLIGYQAFRPGLPAGG